MSLVQESFQELFPDRQFSYAERIKYSAKFKSYNANVKLNTRTNELIFSLSSDWKDVSDDIKKGLIQELLLRLFKAKKKTLHMDLYSGFLKNVHLAVPKNNVDPYLKESYDRVNEIYFRGMFDMPNLKWGSNSFRKLGSYHYGDDCVTMSEIFRNSPLNLLDYVMYHELLHKKHKFSSQGGRNYHHTTAFRLDESKFEGHPKIEKELSLFVRNSKYGLVKSVSKVQKKVTKKSLIKSILDEFF